MNRLPKIDIDELRKAKEENFKERLEFLDSYANWVKNTSNAKWSSAHKSIVNRK